MSQFSLVTYYKDKNIQNLRKEGMSQVKVVTWGLAGQKYGSFVIFVSTRAELGFWFHFRVEKKNSVIGEIFFPTLTRKKFHV